MQNQAPIWSLLPKVQGVAPTAANTKSDGTGTIATDLFKAYTAGADGDWISVVRISLVASAAATLTSATVIRGFVCTIASGATTPNTNIWQLFEQPLAAATVDNSTTVAANPIEIPINKAIPPNSLILVSTHVVPAASTSYQCSVYGGGYSN